MSDDSGAFRDTSSEFPDEASDDFGEPHDVGGEALYEDEDPAPDGRGDDGEERRPAGIVRQPWIVGLVIVVFAGVAGLWLGTSQRRVDDDAAEDDAAAVETPDAAVPAEAETSSGDLYFPGSGGRLYREQRELPVGTPAARARTLVEALLAGPAASDSGLRSPLPAGTRVETVYLMGAIAVLDLRPAQAEEGSAEGPPTASEAHRNRLSYGSMQELLALYSLVNTVALGVEGIDSVQILWDGRQPETFAGHVDTTRPLTANPSYIAGR